MPTLYTRTFNLKDSLSDAEVLDQWRFLMEEVVPACQQNYATQASRSNIGIFINQKDN